MGERHGHIWAVFAVKMAVSKVIVPSPHDEQAMTTNPRQQCRWDP